MERNFADEFKSRVRKIDKIVIEETVSENGLYDIHKRSLPIGKDVVVFVGVDKQEAEWLVSNYLKTKCVSEPPHYNSVIVYYDIIPQNCRGHEKSVFYNKSPVTCENVY